MSERKSFSSPSLEGAETLHERERYDDKDVFGHEEEHDVRKSIWYFQHRRSIFSILDTSFIN